MPCNYWISAFAGTTIWWKSDRLFSQVNTSPLMLAARSSRVESLEFSSCALPEIWTRPASVPETPFPDACTSKSTNAIQCPIRWDLSLLSAASDASNPDAISPCLSGAEMPDSDKIGTDCQRPLNARQQTRPTIIVLGNEVGITVGPKQGEERIH